MGAARQDLYEFIYFIEEEKLNCTVHLREVSQWMDNKGYKKFEEM